MDERIKQRLIGATVLIALAVIFVPVILEGPEEEFGPWGTRMPDPPAQDLLGDLEPLALPERGASEPVKRIVLDAREMGQDVPGTDDKPVDDPLIPPAAEPDEAAKPEAAPEGNALRGWVVQVGSFGKRQNALGLRDRLRARGYAAFVERVGTKERILFRVRVGPELKRSDAQAHRDRIAKEFKLEGRVTTHP